ncbi:endonuclease/exonuclease/phosphatase family protein [Streptomyces sp. GC420]|uniref:endonuclease/exonuclease/phosphatase family protein n=1 Tax=Streptomyces sp. GC420 TaxID=2697568 RepID=UPI0014150D5E|nr:endonuclease/exonuclease/phosphatase family protein [Streptomyces sp. GC420]NBM18197.1 endonuclease/exonuclease/phosphatase family protein [Streptomyces sp. GC420]
MFWNLYETGIERLRGCDERWKAQCALVAALRPRVLLTTEGWGWHRAGGALFEEAKTAFGMDGELFTAKTGCHQAVFWEPDVERVAVERVAPELAHWHGHGLVTLRLPGWSTPLRFLVAHLDPFSPTGRRVEADHLRHHADPALPPLVVGLDANCVPPGDPEPDWTRAARHRRDDLLLPGGRRADRTPLDTLLGDPGDPLLVDAGAHLGDRSPTYGEFMPGEPERRIDLFLLSVSLVPLLTAYHAPDPRPRPDERRPPASDHRPVTIRLRRR